MAGRERDITTESDDADDSADDSTAGKFNGCFQAMMPLDCVIPEAIRTRNLNRARFPFADSEKANRMGDSDC